MKEIAIGTYQVNTTITREAIFDLTEQCGIDIVKEIESELVTYLHRERRINNLGILISRLNEKSKKGR